MSKAKVLLVEDDSNLGQILCEYLQMKSYEVDLCRDGEEGLAAFENNTYDICLLDVMMPKMDGFTLTKNIRTQNKQIPIIFITAKSLKEDVIEGFKLGGDDYISKPFSMEELLVRIQAVLKRTQSPTVKQSQFQIRDYLFDADEMILTHKGEKNKLTSKESQLLSLLCQYKNQVLQRDVALKEVWGDDSYFNARSMDVYITKLRKLFKEEEDIKIINIHGKGFKLLVK